MTSPKFFSYTLMALILMPNFGIAQRAIEQRVKYRLSEPARIVYDSSINNYQMKVVVVDQKYGSWNEDLILSYKDSIQESINIPDRTKIGEGSSEDAALTITITFGQLYHSAWVKDAPGLENYYFVVGKLSLPINLSWNFRDFADMDYTYDYVDLLDEDGKYNYESERYEGKSQENKQEAQMKAAKEYISYFLRYLDDVNKRYYPQIADRTVFLYTLKDKKQDFSDVDEAYNLAVEGIALIEETDFVPNEAASRVIDQAIVKFDQIISTGRVKKKIPLWRLYSNKINLQILIGNFTDAISTRNTMKKEIGGFSTAGLEDYIRSLMSRYDELGYSYK